MLLQVIDLKWREHLYEMDYLKEGIGLRAMGQRDPLIEYQREAHQMFGAMADAVKEQALQVLYRVEKRETGASAGPLDAASAAAADGAQGAQRGGRAGGFRREAQATATRQSAPRVEARSGSTMTGGGAGERHRWVRSRTRGPSDDGSGKATTTKAKCGEEAEADGRYLPWHRQERAVPVWLWQEVQGVPREERELSLAFCVVQPGESTHVESGDEPTARHRLEAHGQGVSHLALGGDHCGLDRGGADPAQAHARH